MSLAHTSGTFGMYVSIADTITVGGANDVAAVTAAVAAAIAAAATAAVTAAVGAALLLLPLLLLSVRCLAHLLLLPPLLTFVLLCVLPDRSPPS